MGWHRFAITGPADVLSYEGTEGMTVRRPILVLCISALMTALMAASAAAQAPAAGQPTLSGETLTGPAPATTVTCRAGALDFTVTYSAAGTAAGPDYPGTFT